MTEQVDLQRQPFQEGSFQQRREILHGTTIDALAEADLATLRLVLNNQHPADLAELLRVLDEEDQQAVLQLIAEPLAARALAESDTPTMLSVTEDLDDELLSDLVEEMAPDDAADLLGDLPVEQSQRLLDLMDDTDSAVFRELLEHDDDSGGGIMTSRVVSVPISATVGEAIAHLREWARDGGEEFQSLFVIEASGVLGGTVPLSRMLVAQPERRISELVVETPVSVTADLDQQEIARIFQEYDLLVIPVVDGDGRLIGQVTVDDIVDVIEDEATEDMYEMAATSAEERSARSVFGVIRLRLPWLLVCLCGTLVSGGIIKLFSGTLASLSALILFVPAIMAMGGNTGIQTSTVTVRSLAIGYLQGTSILQILWRELLTACGMGVALGAIVFGVAHLWTASATISSCVGLAMFAAVLLSAMLGAVVPLLFRACGIDPAVASGPLITTLNDVVSLLIYFGIAASLLHIAGP